MLYDLIVVLLVIFLMLCRVGLLFGGVILVFGMGWFVLYLYCLMFDVLSGVVVCFGLVCLLVALSFCGFLLVGFMIWVLLDY